MIGEYNAHCESVLSSVSHISWGSSWVGAVRSIDDQIQSWAPQVPEVLAVTHLHNAHLDLIFVCSLTAELLYALTAELVCPCLCRIRIKTWRWLYCASIRSRVQWKVECSLLKGENRQEFDPFRAWLSAGTAVAYASRFNVYVASPNPS